MTLRQWAIDDRIPFCRVGCEGRFSRVDVENVEAWQRLRGFSCPEEVLSVRVSGSNGHESSRSAAGETAGNLLG
jgi:hypothetical protein